MRPPGTSQPRPGRFTWVSSRWPRESETRPKAAVVNGGGGGTSAKISSIRCGTGIQGAVPATMIVGVTDGTGAQPTFTPGGLRQPGRSPANNTGIPAG